MILGYPEETLRSANGLATAREIRQQPATWRETLTMVEECRATIERFLLPLLSRGNLRVILTGAGTSAFAGRALAPYLSARLNGRFEAIATTDIVTDPGEYLAQDCPTLLGAQCAACHKVDYICPKMDEGRSSLYWRRTISDMVDEGAVLNGREQAVLVRCLSSRDTRARAFCPGSK